MSEEKFKQTCKTCDIDLTDGRDIPDVNIRDYFAGMALTGFLSNTMSPQDLKLYQSPKDDLAIASYKIADAMLKARES